MHGTLMQKTNPIATIYDHEKDIRLSIQLNRWLLKPIGVWPKSAETSWIEKYIYILVNVICTSLIGFLFIPCAAYMALEVEDTYNTLKLSGPLSFCLMAVIKYSSLIFRENDIRRGIEHIENDWMNTQHYEDRIIMIRNAKFGRRLVTICAFFMYGGAVFYYLAMPFSNGKVTEADGNLTYRPLVYPVARVIIDARYSPISEIFFWVQCLSGFIAHSITAGACSVAAVFAMHAYGRLEVLMQWIKHLVDGREDFHGNLDKRLSMIVQQHVRILQ
ncbi:odorant receptor 82a-like protein [Lasius niger]|uniref:Odorant receptor 82a-like protein n=1 Tax=Lasius niger TaxID=67767 RepID=A0A0J7NLQ0_LASNI|nr:odorant receptor 82a-like protein [Lasius niger]